MTQKDHKSKRHWSVRGRNKKKKLIIQRVKFYLAIESPIKNSRKKKEEKDWLVLLVLHSLYAWAGHLLVC